MHRLTNLFWAYLISLLGGVLGSMLGTLAVLVVFFRWPVHSPEMAEALTKSLVVGLFHSGPASFLVLLTNKAARNKATAVCIAATTVVSTCVTAVISGALRNAG
jgi:hypothetical protein